MDYKAEFLRIYNDNIKREGKEDLLKWLEKSDFFQAPASTKFHLNYEGGLVEHCVNVAQLLFERFPEEDPESLAICGLLHDVCKANYYKASTKNVKNPVTGAWETQSYYTVEEKFPYGHGEKSVFLIERFMRLEIAEAVAIRWHMGGFDSASRGGDYSEGKAYEMYPLAVKLALCDMESSYLREKR